MASKYAEDEAFLNYNNDPDKCKSCIKKDKLIIKHWEKNDSLQTKIKEINQFCNKLIMDNCKLKDQVNTLSKLID
tara:strand:+ start:138 stop:362 length:225 start_codon:yes stop_codon:yes gene_type:complete